MAHPSPNKNYPSMHNGVDICGDWENGYVCTLENEPYHPLGEHVAHVGQNAVAWVWPDIRHPSMAAPVPNQWIPPGRAIAPPVQGGNPPPLNQAPPALPPQATQGISDVMKNPKKPDPYDYEITEWDLLPDAD